MDRRRPTHITDLDHRHRITQAANITERVSARIFQRDLSATKPGKARNTQTLDAYDIWGKPIENVDAEKLKQQINQTIVETISPLSEHELDYFAMLVPQYVQAITSSEKYIDEVYQKDMLAIVKVAIDWFMHPEEIEKTHIRIGFGGEEIVNSRLPAYIVPALHMLEEFKGINEHYRNWSMLNALQDKAGEPRAKDINAYMVSSIDQTINAAQKTEDFEKHIGQKIAERRKQHRKKVAFDEETERQKAILEEMEENKFLSSEQVRLIITSAWTEFTENPPNIQELQQQYHFTDQLPKIVAFNAANAAIEIDQMQRDNVLLARENSQKLLKAYVAEFHPELTGQLIFQNDVSWDQLSHHAKMQLLFAHELIDTFDGKKEEVEARLARFGDHHRRRQENTILGMSISEAYGAAHAFFFQDKYTVDAWAEKLPSTRIMEMVEVPRNVLYHQGPPEKEFGVYRKLFSENATVTQFIDWLRRRQKRAHFENETQMHFDELATQVYQQAKNIQQEGDVKGRFAACVGKAIYFKEKNSAAVGVCVDPKTAAAKQEFFRFIATDRFKNSANQEKEWLHYIKELIIDRPWEKPEEIEDVIKQMQAYQERMKRFDDKVHVLRQREDDVATDTLIAEQGVEGQEAVYPINKAELVVSVGDLPTYYHFGRTDSVTWPSLEHASLKKYEEAKDVVDRLYGVGTTVKDQIVVSMLNEPITQGWEVFADGITKIVKDAIPEEQFLNMVVEDKKALEGEYSDIVQMEIRGINHDEILFELEKRLRAIVDTRAQIIHTQTGIDQAAALYYSTKFYLPALNDVVMTDLAAEQFKVRSATRDFRLMMEDISPNDSLDAERRYNQLLTQTFSIN